MAALWNTFSFWEQAFLVALGIGCACALAGFLLAHLVEPFDEDALDQQRPEGE